MASKSSIVVTLCCLVFLVGLPTSMCQDGFIGEIKCFGFNFCPRGWVSCNGQLMSIAQNTALFSLLGTMYGGNGATTFGVPDLRGRVIVHTGQGPGLSSYTQGAMAGTETVTLLAAQMPTHTHNLVVNSGVVADSQTPGSGAAFAIPTKGNVFTSTGIGGTFVNLAASSVSNAGSGGAHPNMQPYTVLNCCLQIEGIYPSRN